MSTYLFTWKQEKWKWTNLNKMIAELPNKKPIHQWKTNRKNNIGPNDNFLLMKLGSIPKSEKGIIGIGKITSNPYKDKDVIQNVDNTNFVDLEFSKLSRKAFISLIELEKIDPSMHWTPEGNGNSVSESTFEKILNLINKEHNSILFEKKIYFPIIAETIDIALTQKTSIHRDEIVQILLEKYDKTLDKIAKNSNKSILFIAQNMVDWFSAELTKQSNIVEEWKDKYTKTRIKINNREITNYSLALNTLQDEKIEENNISYTEGAIKKITVNAYERNEKARKVCLKHHGYTCQCCFFNFEKIYGSIGKDFIHVHHIKPLSEIKKEYVLNPVTDLIPVCANCHAMLHRKIPAYEIEEIRILLCRNKSQEL